MYFRNIIMDQNIYIESLHQAQEMILSLKKQLLTQTEIDVIKEDLQSTKEELKLTKTKLHTALKENDQFKKNTPTSIIENMDKKSLETNQSQVLSFLRNSKFDFTI